MALGVLLQFYNLSVSFLLCSGDSDIDSSPRLVFVNFNFHLSTLIYMCYVIDK